MCIRDRYQRRVRGVVSVAMADPLEKGFQTEVLLQRLRARDAREVEAFDELTRAYAHLLHSCNASNVNLAAQNKRVLDLQENNEAVTAELQRVQDQGGMVVDSAKISMLEGKISELQVERGDLYQQQSTQNSKLLEMNEQVDKAEEAMARYKEQIDALQAQCTTKDDEIAALKDTLDQVNSQSDNWQNQTKTLNGLLDALRTEHDELKNLHEDLVGRWVAKSEELSQQHNELNKMRQQLQQDRRAFDVLEEVRQGATGEGSVNIADVIDQNFMVPTALPTELKTRIKTHEKECNQVAFNNNTGSYFATSSADKNVKVWQVMGISEGGEHLCLSGHAQAALSVSFSPDDSLVLSGGADNSVRIWAAGTGRGKHVLAGHKDKVFNARSFPDCRNAVTGSHDRTVKYWDLGTGKCLQTILGASMINDVAVPPDGMHVVSGHYDGSIRFNDPRTKEELAKLEMHAGHVTSVCYTPCGTKLVTNSRDSSLKLIDIRMFGELCTMKDDGYRNTLSNSKAAVSPNGRYVAAGGHNGSVHIWDLHTSRYAKRLYDTTATTETIISCSWSPNGQDLAVSDRTGVVCVWSS
eukprot:TRINITY_DN26479_c0_g1_i2.p1 TRINITY_DN26479_c0_g1~~TRINITY_DN26479_c0_g1_i2.p1  ORF type:complete len:581 (-),score=145.75 TRINITY_DN26479_c0_g1_i2:227-1969(-)